MVIVSFLNSDPCYWNWLSLAQDVRGLVSPQCLRGDDPGVCVLIKVGGRYLLEVSEEHPQGSVVLLKSPSSVGKSKRR